MSAADVAGWKHIHGLRQDLLNQMGLTRGAIGQGYHDPTFSPANYIHKMFASRPMLTRLHQRLTEQIPGALIRVRFEKNGRLLILVSGRTASGDETYYHFNIDNIYDAGIPPIREYNTIINRRDQGRYLPIRAIVYRTVREVAQQEQAVAVGETYERVANSIGHPDTGNVRWGPVGNILRFMGGKKSRKHKGRAKKSRKYRR